MSKRLIALSVRLFGIVPEGTAQETDFKASVPYGFIADTKAAHALPEILSFIKGDKLKEEQLNATFYKSWQKIKTSSREELLIDQILHYLSTYGTNFSSDYVYYPEEVVGLPASKLPIRVIRGVPLSSIIEEALHMLSSGIALEDTTIDSLLELLDALGHSFTSVENIKNKEALVRIIAKTGVYPSSPAEFLRFLVYASTGSTLLIKNNDLIEAIKTSDLDVRHHINTFGVRRCAEVFNRFKPIWLAFKANGNNRVLVNEISRLAKRFHKPMPTDILNELMTTKYGEKDILRALDQVPVFRKIRLLNALNTRIQRPDSYLYRIRNGSSFTKEKGLKFEQGHYQHLYALIYSNLLESIDLKGKRILYPENVDYAIPSSEKMFIGNFPVGTVIRAPELVAGIYWRNEWGADDLDVSALYVGGKVGWNSDYKSAGLLYSGDVTKADNGAVEYLYVNGKLKHSALFISNIYRGNVGCKFKIIVGSAPAISENYMLDGSELIVEAEANMLKRQQIIGLFLPEKDDQASFVLVNASFGSFSVSGDSAHAVNARNALYTQFYKPISFKKLLLDAGAQLCKDTPDVNLMPHELNKQSLINLLVGHK